MELDRLLEALEVDPGRFVPVLLSDELDDLKSLCPRSGEEIHLTGAQNGIVVRLVVHGWAVTRIIPLALVRSQRDAMEAISFAIATCRLDFQKVLSPCDKQEVP